MTSSVKIHYLEVVTSNVDQVCDSYSQTLGVSFGEPIPELGDARTAKLFEGGLMGVRLPMHDAEEHTTRPYYLVPDIATAVEKAEELGALIAVPPMEILGYGKCAILMHGTIQSGVWEV